MSIPPPSAPRDPNAHVIRDVTLTTGGPSDLSEGRKATIGQSMAKVKAFMERCGNTNIQEFGRAIQNNYQFSLFPQKEGGFLLEIGDKHVHVTPADEATREIAEEVQTIWHQIHGATVRGSTERSDSPSSSSPSSGREPSLTSGTPSPATSSHPSTNPRPITPPNTTDRFSPRAPDSGIEHRHVRPKARRDSTESIASTHVSDFHSILDDSLEANPSSHTLLNQEAIIYSAGAKNPPNPNLETRLERLSNAGLLELSRYSFNDQPFVETILQGLEATDNKDILLDLALLQDILTCLNQKRFKDAAITLTLLRPDSQDLLIHNLGLRNQIRQPIYLPSDEEAINEITRSLQSLKPHCVADVERTKSHLLFSIYKETASHLETQTTARYTEANPALEQKNHTLKSQASRYRNQREQARQDLEAKQQELDALQQTLNQTVAICNDLARQLTEATQNLESQQQNHDSRLTELTSRLTQAEQQKEDLRRNLEALNQKNQAITARLTQALTLGEELRAIVATKQAELEASNTQLALLQGQIDTLNRKVDAELGALGTAESLIQGTTPLELPLEQKLDILIEALRQKIAQGDQEAESNQAEALRLAEQHRTLYTEKKARLADIAALEDCLRQATTANSTLEADKKRLTDEKTALEKQIEEQQKQIATADAQIASLQKANAFQQQRIGSLEAQISRIGQDLKEKDQALQKAARDLEGAKKALSAQAQQHDQALKQATQQFSTSQENLASIKAAHDQLQQDYHKQQQALAQLQQELAALKQALGQEKATSQRSIQALQKSLAQAQQDKDTLSSQLSQKDAAFAKTDQELKELRRKKQEDEGLISRQRSEIDGLKTRVSTIEASLKQSDATNAQLQTALKEATQEFKEQLVKVRAWAQKHNTALANKLQDKERKLAALTKTLEDAQQDRASIFEQLRQKITATEALTGELSAAKRNYDTAFKALAAATDKNKALEDQLAILQKAQRTLIAEHQAKIEEITSYHAAHIEDVESRYKQQLDRLTESKNEQVAALAQELQEKEALISSQQETIREQQRAILAIARRLNIQQDDNLLSLEQAIGNKLSALEAEKQALQAKVAASHDELDAKGQELKQAQEDFAQKEQALRQDISSLSLKNQTQAQHLQHNLEQIASLQQDITTQKEAYEHLLSLKDRLESALEKEKSKNQVNQSTLLQNEATIQALQERIVALSQSQTDTQASLATALTEKATIEQALSQALSDIKDKDTNLAAQVEIIQNLQSDLKQKEAAIQQSQNSLEAQIKALKEDKEGLKGAIDELRSSVEAEVQKFGRTLSTLQERSQAQTSSLQAAHTATSAALKEAENKLKDLEKKAAKLSLLEEALSPQNLTTPEAISFHLNQFQQLLRLQQEFEAKLKPFGDTPASIQQHIQATTQKSTSLVEGLSQKADQIKGLQKRLEEALAEKETLEQENQKLQAEISSQKDAHTSALAKAEQQLQDKDLQIAALTQKLADLQASTQQQVETLRQAHAQLSKNFLEENKNLQAALKEKEAKIAALEPQSFELNRLQEALAPQNLTTPEAITSYLEAFQQLQSFHASFQTELGQIGATPIDIKNHIEAQKTALEVLAASAENEAQKCTQLETRLQNLEKELALKEQSWQKTQQAHEAEIAGLKQELTTAQLSYSQQIAQLTASLSNQEQTAQKTIDELQKAADEQLKIIDQCRGIIASQEQGLAFLKEALEAKNFENTSLKQDFKEAQKATVLTKLQALLEKKQLTQKAKAFRLLQLASLSQKQEKEKQALQQQLEAQKAVLSSLNNDHQALISFLKQQLKPGDTLDPGNELEALKELFAARLKEQEQKALQASTEYAEASGRLASQQESLTQKQGQIATLEALLAQSEAKIGTLEAAQAQVTQIKDNLATQLAQIASLHTQDESTLGNLQAELSALSSTQQATLSDKTQLERQNQDLQTRLQALQAELSSQKASLASLQQTHEHLERSYHEQNQALSEARKDYAGAVQAYDQQRKDHASAIEHLTRNHDLAISDLQRELQEARSLIDKKEQQLKGLKQDIEKLQKEHRQELASLKEQLKASQSSMEEQSQSHQEEIASLKRAQSAILEEKQQQLKTQEGQLQALKEQYQQVEALAKDQVKQLQQNSHRLADLSRTNTALETANGSLTQQLSSLRQQLQEKLELLALQKGQAEAKIGALEQEKQALSEQLASLSEKNTIQSQEISRVMAELQTRNQTIEALEKQRSEIADQLLALESSSTRHTASLEKEKQDLKNTIASLETELRNEKETLSSMAIAQKSGVSGLLAHLTSLERAIPAIAPMLEALTQKATTTQDITIDQIVSCFEPLSAIVSTHLQGIASSDSSKQEQLGTLQQNLAALKIEHARVQEALAASQDRIKSLTQDLEAQQQLFEQKLAAQQKESQDKLDVLRASQNDSSRALVDQIASLTARNEDTSQQMSALKEANASLHNEVAKILSEKEQLQQTSISSLEALQQNLAVQKDINQGLQIAYQEQLSTIEQKRGVIATLERELVQVRAHNAELSGELTSLKKEYAQNLARYQILEAQLKTVDANQQAKQEQIALSSSQLQALREEKQTLSSALESQKIKISHIEAHNLALAEKMLEAQRDEALAKHALQQLQQQLATSQTQISHITQIYKQSEADLRDLRGEFGSLNATYQLLSTRNRQLEERQEAAISAGPVALAAQKQAYEQLIASLQMASVITQEALPTTAYGRFDRLYHSNTAAIVTALKDLTDFNLRIRHALKVPPDHLKASCEKALIILSMPFADDASFATALLKNLVHTSFDPSEPVKFPSLASLHLDPAITVKMEDGRSKARAGVAAASSKEAGIEPLFEACCEEIKSELSKRSPSLKPPKATAARASAPIDPSSALSSLSSTLSAQVRTLLTPETTGGRYGTEKFFAETFMTQEEIQHHLLEGKTTIPLIQKNIDAAKQAVQETKQRLEDAKGAIAPSATGTSVSSITSSRGTGESALQVAMAKSAYDEAVYNLRLYTEELGALEAFEDLRQSEELSSLLQALTQAFANGSPYFAKDSLKQKQIEQIVTYFTHVHLDRLLHLIVHNPSLAKDLSVARILIGTQMLGHANKEMHELKNALKSAFTLLKQLYTAVYLRL